MKLTPATRLMELLERFPFLIDFLAAYHPHFGQLKNPILRKTLGRFATLSKVAEMGGLQVDLLLRAIQDKVRQDAGESLEVEAGAAAGPTETDAARMEGLKDIIRALHAGETPAALKQKFAELLKDVDPAEIARLEQQMVQEGLPAEEIKKLCDVHVEVFKEALSDQAPVSLKPGHPLHTMEAENDALKAVAESFAEAVAGLCVPPDPAGFAAHADTLKDMLASLAQVERHYTRKENQLFPILERHGLSGPPQVMWAIHDDVRALLKEVSAALQSADLAALAEKTPRLVRMITEMVYKEQHILFPMSLQILGEGDWAEIRRGEAALGYALVTPGTGWTPAAGAPAPAPVQPAAAAGAAPAGTLWLDTGLLTLDQVNLMLKNLPVDITYVDEQDRVRYYSEGVERVFPRSPEIIGRAVQQCHPPKSIGTVNRILAAFKDGSKNTAEFWIRMQGRVLHIRYFALRDTERKYRGCLEVTQDITAIQQLQGERRLLDWDNE